MSRAGTLCVADVIRDGRVVVTVASMYAAWETARTGRTIYPTPWPIACSLTSAP